MNLVGSRLHALILQTVAINSVSIGIVGNPATVKVDPQSAQAAAQSIIDSFDWSQAGQDAFNDAQEPNLAALKNQAIQAINDINNYLVIADNATNIQVRAEVKAIDQRQKVVIQALVRIVQILTK